MKRIMVLLASLAVMGVSTAWAAGPTLIPYQGRLTDASGSPISGSRSVTFALYSVASGGAAIFSETQSVTVANGLFSVSIGSATVGGVPATAISAGPLYLGIKVEADAEMTPRQQLGSVPYAYRSVISPGAAYAVRAAAGVAVVGSQDMVSVAATFPAVGYAIVYGEAYCQANHVVGNLDQFSIGINTVSATMPAFPHVTRFTVDDSHPTTSFGVQTGLAIMRVLPVSAGSQTFYLVGQENAGDIILWGAQITVQYVPDALGPVALPQAPAVPQDRAGLAPTAK